MHKIVRGLMVGTLVGTAVGVVMLMRDRKAAMMMPAQIKEQSRGTMRMVRDNARKWTSAMKSGTEAFSHKLARRIT